MGSAIAPSGRSPTFFESLVAGGLAGTSVDLFFFPIDTIKTRLQSGLGFARAGGLRGVYKGVGSVIVGSAPGAAAFFSTYETFKRHLPIHGQLAPLNHMVSASIGEIAACLIRVPTEVVKTRAQTSRHGKHARPSLNAAAMIYMHDGWRGFYRGFGITITREIPFTSVQFPLYELFKSLLSRHVGRKPLYAYEAAACGSLAGGIAAAVTTPLDVLKTRVMLDMVRLPVPYPCVECMKMFPKRPTESPLPSLINRAKMIYMQEGISALFAGVVPRTLWISAGGAVFLGVYEWAVHGLMRWT